MMKYPIFEDGVWINPNYRNFRIICCDCGLVHDVNFRIKGGRIQFKLNRNNRSTGQIRRYSEARKAEVKNDIREEKQ